MVSIPVTFKFKEDIKVLADLETKQSAESGRKYVTPVGDLPSITTVLSFLSKKDIDNWKARVGEGKAAYVSKNASERGTELHRLCECYTLGQEIKSNDYTALDLFNQIKVKLDKSLGLIYYQECALYSSILKIAGRCDLIAEWDGELSIIDYKSSKKLKTVDDIEGYFLQTTAYSIMLQELTGYVAKKIVVIIGNDQSSHASVFVGDRMDWVKRLFEVRKEYEKTLD